jgi:ABC-2 type transport system permease protein
MNVMPMLIRREFWEHRMMLLLAPLVLCVVYLILCVLAGAKMQVHLPAFSTNEAPTATALLIVMHTMFTVLLYLLMAVVAFFYLCDCLYAERKDRSILFWKSLPVSDALTVLAKLIVALIAIPAVVYVLSFLTNLIAFGIFKVMVHTEVPPGIAADWSVGGWLRLNGYLLVDIPVLALWFAPVAAYQLLISAFVPRAPFVFTLLPPLALIFGEPLFFGTWHIGSFVGHRLGAAQLGPHMGRGVEGVIEALNALPMLQRLDLWMGVLVAVALIVLTIRIRRHRDDS